jgi:hypothetical protein
MIQGAEHTGGGVAKRARTSEAGSATALPLLLCIAALVAAALLLAMFATGLADNGSGSTPSWSGAQGPPGAVGLSPHRGVLRHATP